MQFRATWVALGLALAGAAGSPAARAEESPEARIRQWVRQLGSGTFEEREAASAALRDIGAPARQELEAAAGNDDPEVRARAEDLLRTLRLGITRGAPPALADLMRRYENLPVSGRREALARLAAELKADAVPFFVHRTAVGEPWEGQVIADRLTALGSTNAWRGIIETIREPANSAQASLLAQACLAIGSIREMTAALSSKAMAQQDRRRLADIVFIRLKKDAGSAEELVEAVRTLGAGSADPRFLYAEAAVLRKQGKNEEAAQRAAKALAMNPAEESPHYQAAEFLEGMTLPDLARKEWEKILEIPPKGDVYDVNAWIRIGRILCESDPEEAAEAYEKALAAYRTAKTRHGRSMGMAGGSEAEIEKRIRELRGEPRAAGGEESPFALDVDVESKLKKGSQEDLAAAREKADGSLSVNVEPEGFRLFEEAKTAEFRYDAKEGAFKVLLNGSPCAAGMPFEPRKKILLMELRTLDCVYYYEVDTAAGITKLTSKFEYDYVLRIKAGPGFKNWTDIEIKVGDKTYDPAKAAEGIGFDYLPKKLEIEVRGTTPEGKSDKMTYTVRPAGHRREKPAAERQDQPKKDDDREPKDTPGRMVVDPRRMG